MDESRSPLDRSWSAAGLSGQRGFVQDVKARLEGVSRAVLDVKRAGASPKTAETAIAEVERFLAEVSLSPELSARAPAVFFRKCKHLLQAQREKLAELSGEEPEQPCNVTLRRSYGKPVETEERQALLPEEPAGRAAPAHKLAGLLDDYQQVNRVYDSIHRVLVEQRPAIALIDRAAEETLQAVTAGAKNLHSTAPSAARWALLALLVCAFLVLLIAL